MRKDICTIKDLTPAFLVLASVKKGDVILCQITSKPYSDPAAIVITANDFN